MFNKKKDEDGNGSAGAKRPSELQRPGGQAKASTSSSKAIEEQTIVEDEDEDEDPFAADKEVQRDSAEGKGGPANFTREIPTDSPISDAKSDRYNNSMADSKDTTGSK